MASTRADLAQRGAASADELRQTDVVTVENRLGDKKVRKVVGVRDGKVVWRQG